ncbi:response regulator [Devosia submarina]|uniref:response regulator n=1 Tax=Devosia submarina TaxID=1173082 RepID=UPI000D37D617|nr:response regulator [Devosia submarina]
MTTAKHTPRKAFLIVDDEPLARMELTQIVRDCGYAVREASNTVEALSILEADSDQFMGLITDINMPGTRSGIVLANHVRCIWPHIEIIVVSAARTPLNGELPERVEFLNKPVPPSRLVSAIQSSSQH